ncbi:MULTISPECIES: IS3 family transposase [Pandoraea]|uniref:IS3 family transposase n=1 Tax=Pandoraea sp. CB10b_02 TaxID=2014535 RepID=UPI00278C4057|nr:IS3 family transposase [Pandoraea nosoerga]
MRALAGALRIGISRSLFHYESRRRVDDEALTGRMMAIAAQKRRYGYRRIHVLLQRDGPTKPVSRCRSFGLASRWRTPISRASTGGSAMNA